MDFDYDLGVATREQNERKFGNWSSLPNGGRRYWLDVQGRFGWTARYLKDVDADENTVRFWQEIFNQSGQIVEIHVKFPTDEGHRKV